MNHFITQKQMDLISHLFIIESNWNEETVQHWMNQEETKDTLAGLTVQEILLAGTNWSMQMNQKLGVSIY